MCEQNFETDLLIRGFANLVCCINEDVSQANELSPIRRQN